jgi:hypothetical protein
MYEYVYQVVPKSRHSKERNPLARQTNPCVVWPKQVYLPRSRVKGVASYEKYTGESPLF